MIRYHELPPNAGRVINSLRDSGYNFNTAVADVIDNSIAADADVVRVFGVCDVHDGSIRVVISDNGCGMSLDELCNALTYGSDERKDAHSLGKYGLGLKTASTSQCRRVSLISRKSGSSEVNKLVLDIDHAAKTKRWEYIEDEPSRLELRYLEASAGQGSGTAVIWENCDRILGRNYKNPGGQTQQNAFKRKLDSLRFHLSMVFERFLDQSDERARNVRLFINSDELRPYDPFARDLNTDLCYKGRLDVSYEDDPDEVSAVTAAAYVVPARDELKSMSEIDGVFPKGINPDSMQGIYVYRENRLIHWGDWCGIHKSEFHYRLCRVELSFDADLDDLFNVDYQKSKVSLDSEVEGWLKSDVLPLARQRADARYRKGVVENATRPTNPIHSRSNTTISKMERSDKGRKFQVDRLPGDKRRIRSEKGRSFIEVIPRESYSENRVNIRLVETLPEAALWRSGLFNDGGATRTYVEINTSHPFYQRAMYACKGNTNALRCLDYLLWSLAQAEYATKDQESLSNYYDMISEVSRTLRMLAGDLPEDES